MATAYAHERVPLTRAEYDELVRRGALDQARVELLYGRIVSMSPIGGPHVYSVDKLAKIFFELLGDRARVRIQAPFAAPRESEPEPDVSIVPPGDYLDDHPQTAWLLVEVAESSLAHDRKKAALYAAAGVTEYWIVNLKAESVEVHRDVRDGRYEEITYHGRGDVLRLVHFPDAHVRVAEIVPPRR